MDILQVWVLIMVSIFLLLPCDRILFSVLTVTTFHRQEYSLSPYGTNLNCLLGWLKHRWVPHLGGARPENPYQNLDNEHQSLTPIGNQPDRWRNHYVCKKFYPEVQSQDDSTKKPVSPSDNTLRNQKSDTADRSHRAAQQTAAAEHPGICKWKNT